MKKLIPITLTFLLLFFVNSAMADRGYDRDGYRTKGERIEHRFDKKGDRIERKFDRKAAIAAEQGKYRKAYRLSKKGDRIDRRFDRKGERLQARYDQRRYDQRRYNQNNQHHRTGYYRPAPRVVYPAHDHRGGDYLSLMISQPGFLFGWGFYH